MKKLNLFVLGFLCLSLMGCEREPKVFKETKQQEQNQVKDNTVIAWVVTIRHQMPNGESCYIVKDKDFEVYSGMATLNLKDGIVIVTDFSAVALYKWRDVFQAIDVYGLPFHAGDCRDFT